MTLPTGINSGDFPATGDIDDKLLKSASAELRFENAPSWMAHFPFDAAGVAAVCCGRATLGDAFGGRAAATCEGFVEGLG